MPTKSDEGTSRTVAFTEVTMIRTLKHKVRQAVLVATIVPMAVLVCLFVLVKATSN